MKWDWAKPFKLLPFFGHYLVLIINSEQSPSKENPSIVKRALIVAPATLTKNWYKEIGKWLGEIRLKAFVVDSNCSSLKHLTLTNRYPVIIIGYEKLRSIAAEIHDIQFDLIICDEGHRLKNAQAQVKNILNSFKTKRRVLLSGTPIQNDLNEFYSMSDWVNPGFLGSLGDFRKNFVNPIEKGRARDCSSSDRTSSTEKMSQLASLVEKYTLRRTSEVNKAFLPMKTEFVCFCEMTKNQTQDYVNALDSIPSKDSLSVLTELKARANISLCGESGKLNALLNLLKKISTSEERVVIVSHWTSTLDSIQTAINQNSYSFVRLDGSTPSVKRLDVVEKFNRGGIFIFLLSSKAGGGNWI
jgi:DNA repair and recombination protein RAD54B